MDNGVYSLKDFYFDLPDDLIAQYPLNIRDSSRLFVLNKRYDIFEHRRFQDITEYILPGDVLVVNDVRVINARLFFTRHSGAKIEVILAQKIDHKNYLILTNRTKRLKKNEIIISSIDSNIFFTINERNGEYLHAVSNIELTDDVLSQIGEIPLPPYIKRRPDKNDEDRYQTVYSKKAGAVASPTAGLHFTNELVSNLKRSGAYFVNVTLKVSWGTFQPVRNDELSKHQMHSEEYDISYESAEIINKARNEGRRIIAVGTTSLRVLESTFVNGKNRHGNGVTDLFIYPPYDIKSVDALITNFHTPGSTLLMLVSSFAGYERLMKAYKEAVKLKYRFFSYGDAMLIY